MKIIFRIIRHWLVLVDCKQIPVTTYPENVYLHVSGIIKMSLLRILIIAIIDDEWIMHYYKKYFCIYSPGLRTLWCLLVRMDRLRKYAKYVLLKARCLINTLRSRVFMFPNVGLSTRKWFILKWCFPSAKLRYIAHLCYWNKY